MAALRRIPRERGGWWHAYVCPAHGVELDHGDLLAGVFPDGGARCAHGCRVDSAAVRGAWVVLSHQAWARHLRVLAHRGERAEAVAGLAEYAGVYASLATERHGEAQGWMLRGRLFHQALTDAIWAVNIGHAVITLARDGTEDLAAVLPLLDELEQAALEARGVLTGRGQLASNYTAWLNAAGASASRAASAARGLEWDGGKQWLEGEHGLYAHLRVAVAEDGWEWEGSTYYHGFVLRAALLALRSTDPAMIPSDVVGVLAGMTDVLAGIATAGGILPALHDGPYLRRPLALEWLELISLAQQLVPSGGLDAVAARAREELGAYDDGLDRELGAGSRGRPSPGARHRTRSPCSRGPVTGWCARRASTPCWTSVRTGDPTGTATNCLYICTATRLRGSRIPVRCRTPTPSSGICTRPPRRIRRSGSTARSRGVRGRAAGLGRPLGDRRGHHGVRRGACGAQGRGG